MSIPTKLKESAEVLDYTFDWASQYLVTGDTLSTSTWLVPTGITKNSDTFTTGTTTIWLSGGTDGVSYTITNTVTTAGGRTAVRQMVISCQFR